MRATPRELVEVKRAGPIHDERQRFPIAEIAIHFDRIGARGRIRRVDV